MKRTFLVLTLGSLALSACSDDAANANNATNNETTSTNNGTTSTNNGTTSTHNGTNSTNNGTTSTNNGTTSTNNGTNSTNNGTNDSCDTNGFTLVDPQLYLETPDLTLSALSSTTRPYDSFDLEFYGPDSPLEKGPGTYLLGSTVEDQNYASCNNCLILRQNCDANVGCETIYFAKSGEVIVDAVTLVPGVFTGRIVNVILEEVEFGTETFETIPVVNGKTWCIAETAFDVVSE